MQTANQQISRTNRELFRLEGKPSILKALPISLQHIFAMIVANVAPALIVASSIGLSAQDTTKIVQFCMFSAGLATLLQVIGVSYFGARLPLIMGMNFAFVPVVINLANTYGLAASYGATLCGGVCVILFGALSAKLKPFFPPLVTGTTVLTMGISLYPVAINYMAGGIGSPTYGTLKEWGVALFTLLIVLAVSHFAKGYLKMLSMLVGIVAAYLLALALNMVHIQDLNKVPLLTHPEIFPFGVTFVPGAILTMVVMYLVTSVEVIGDTASLTMGAFGREPSAKEISGAIMGKGIIALLTSCLGALPTASFSQNIGIVTMTKAVAKRIFILASSIMILVGFLPPFGALMTSIPNAVLGGATLSVFSIITINGIRLVYQEEMTLRNASILGISLAFGLGLSAVPEAIALAPDAFKTFVGSSPVITSTLVCFVLNLLLPKTTLKQEEAEQQG